MSLLLTGIVYGQQVQFGKPQHLAADRHVVAEGETYYSIARRYGTTVDQLLQMNPELNRQSLRAGMTITVPLVPPLRETAGEPVWHKVAKGETLYRIARNYGESVETLMTWNELTSPQLREGQSLIVGFVVPVPPVGPLTEQQEEQVRQMETKKLQAEEATKKALLRKKGEEKTARPVQSEQAEPLAKEYHEQGIAVWSSSDYDEGNFYALHPTAPKGTEVLVTNPMNGRTVVVKVIGRLPQVQDKNDVIIRISQSAARRLHVLDERFVAQISYRIPLTEQ
ncbi:MAG: LysM peptidoglycan-binding domain-containing protein [Chitinophagales bacterium]|nr:LysM peptidoglycan-binding domain-containing protein [Chitinophagales bacterium]